MGFRSEAYCTIWSIEPISNTYTKGRISISRKDKQTGEYVEDFSGFVNFFGTAAASKATSLKERDRIKLGDVDVNSKYVKEKDMTYYNFNIYSFELVANSGASPSAVEKTPDFQPNIDDGELVEVGGEVGLPF